MRLRSALYAGYVLGMFALINFFHYGSRNVLFPMYEDLRATYGYSNTELGLLGSMFMGMHALTTLPVGWAGDRFDRRRLLALGLVVWSVAGVATAAAGSLIGMMIARAFVGVGTAVCVPVGNALICELFPPEEKARVVSVFNLGLFLGGAGAFAAGAFLGFPLGILVMAVPGLILAPLVLRLDVPPVRVASQALAPATFRSFVRQARALLRIRSLRWILVGAVTMAFAAGGFSGWVYEFVAVTRGLGKAGAVGIMGAAFVGGVFGILTGGAVGDWLCRRVAWGRLAAISIGMMCSAPFVVVLLYADVGPVFYAASVLSMFFMMWYHGPIAASIDDVAPDRSATTAQAVVICSMHLLGTSPSFTVVGMLADRYGLAHALLAPTVAMVVAAGAIARGFSTMAADRAAAASSHHPGGDPGVSSAGPSAGPGARAAL